MSADMRHAELVRQRSQVYDTALRRASADGAFRRRLLAEPRPTLDALADELGLARAPVDVTIEVHDWSASTLRLLLPPPDGRPLTDAELDGVAGGLARASVDAHGCPACPHPGMGTLSLRL